MAFVEGSEELKTLELLGKIIKPAIADPAEWPEILPWIVRSESAGASRSHVYLRSDTPEGLIQRLRKIHVECANSKCNNTFAVIRKHEDGRLWSIHVSGPRDLHKKCNTCEETKKKTLWIYLVAGQAGQSPRVKKAREDSRQRLMDF